MHYIQHWKDFLQKKLCPIPECLTLRFWVIKICKQKSHICAFGSIFLKLGSYFGFSKKILKACILKLLAKLERKIGTTFLFQRKLCLIAECLQCWDFGKFVQCSFYWKFMHYNCKYIHGPLSISFNINLACKYIHSVYVLVGYYIHNTII